jgi:formate--tetrahydrofolate ligase
LAEILVKEIEKGKNDFKALYEWNSPVKEKIEIIAREVYGAVGVEYSKKAQSNLQRIENLGLSNLPVCMAKTQKSFSDNASLLARPEGFTVTVREFELAAGAGFIIPILGNMMRMPGLPAVPASEGMTIDGDGKISGLS